MQVPEGSRQHRNPDNTIVKALARAFRWKRMVESGEFTTIAELANHEGIAPSYMTRVLRLTLIAPAIVEAILNGTQGPEVTLARVQEPFSVEWNISGCQSSDQHTRDKVDVRCARQATSPWCWTHPTEHSTICKISDQSRMTRSLQDAQGLSYCSYSGARQRRF
jgi:hypothetical protein